MRLGARELKFPLYPHLSHSKSQLKMAYSDLREFIAALEKHNFLKRIESEVDTYLEITEIADRIVKNNGPALLFEKPRNFNIPVLINVFGSLERICLALEIENLDSIGEELENLLRMPESTNWLGKFRMIPRLRKLGNFIPREVKTAPCKEIVIKEKPSIRDLPILHCWPQDGGRFITLPCVFTRDPETGVTNCGIYRMQVFDENTTGMHWHIHKHGALHFRKAKRKGKSLEVAVALGCEPSILFSASSPLPGGIDEMSFAGFLRKKPVELIRCETVDIKVPASAEIILEGYVNPDETRMEGPFGDHTGFYSLSAEYPVFHIGCITMRKNPVYLATIVGKPPMEDYFIGKAIERIFLPLIKKQLPEVVDIDFPMEGVFHNLVIVSIDKRFPGHARKVMNAFWGWEQMSFTKMIIVVDGDTNVHDIKEVLWKMGNNIDPHRDIVFCEGPVDALDHASRLPHYGSKMGIDATRKWKEEGFVRPWPDEIKMVDDIIRLVNSRWKEYGFKDIS